MEMAAVDSGLSGGWRRYRSLPASCQSPPGGHRFHGSGCPKTPIRYEGVNPPSPLLLRTPLCLRVSVVRYAGIWAGPSPSPARCEALPDTRAFRWPRRSRCSDPNNPVPLPPRHAPDEFPPPRCRVRPGLCELPALPERPATAGGLGVRTGPTGRIEGLPLLPGLRTRVRPESPRVRAGIGSAAKHHAGSLKPSREGLQGTTRALTKRAPAPSAGARPP